MKTFHALVISVLLTCTGFGQELQIQNSGLKLGPKKEDSVKEPSGAIKTGECALGDLSIEWLECEDGEFMIHFFFDYSNVSDSFHVVVDEGDYGLYAYNQEEYLVGPFPGDGVSLYNLVITDSENEECYVFIGFGAQECPTGDCVIDGLEIFDMECETDSTYTMTFNAEIIDSGNEFMYVWINYDYWSSYEIADLPITVNGILANDSNYDIIQICVNGNEFCCTELEYMVPECIDDGACTIEGLEVFDLECDSDSTYSMTFNLEVINGPTDFIEVSVNNEYLGLFDTSDLPITLNGINTNGSEEDLLMICASELNACCSLLDFVVPDCLVDNIPEIEKQFLIYPNPVSETLFIKSDVHFSASRIIIYDSTGREVMVQSEMVDQISVAELASGVYQVVVFEGG